MTAGAAAGKALMIVSSRSSVALADIAAAAKPSFWYQVCASDGAAKTQAQNAAAPQGASSSRSARLMPRTANAATPASISWSAVDAIKQGISVPVIVKGITTPAEATAAVQHNAGHRCVELWRVGREQRRDDPDVARHCRCGRRQSAGAD